MNKKNLRNGLNFSIAKKSHLGFFHYKKAQIEMQLNWIYVLIVGALIIGFIFMFVRNSIDSSNDQIEQAVTLNLKNILLVSRSNVDTSTPIDLHDVKLKYSCNDGFPTIASDSFTTSIDDVVVFSQEELSGDSMYLWTREWFVPYKVDNFLYLSAPNTLYYFVYDGAANSELGDQINRSIPDTFNVIIDNQLDLSRVVNDNYDYIKLVFIGVDHTYISNDLRGFEFTDVGDAKLTVVSIESDSKEDNYGSVYYHRTVSNALDGTYDSSKYLGFASLLGAVFSDNINDYECSMNMALDKAQYINQVLLDRTTYLLDDASSDNLIPFRCSFYLNKMMFSLEEMSNSFLSDVSLTIGALYAKSSDLVYYNSQSEDDSCPLTY